MVMRKITDDDGKATFNVEYGDYTATIKKNGYATVNKEIAFRSNHKNFTEPLYVGGIATIKVYGMFGMNDVPLENATVTATSHNGLVFTGTTDANGICYLEMPYSSRTIGDYEIVVTKDGFTQDNAPTWEFYDDQNTCEAYMSVSTSDVTINVTAQGEPSLAEGLMKLKSDNNIYFDFNVDAGSATISNVYYGTYLLGCGVRNGGQCFREVIIDNEIETIDVELSENTYSLTVNNNTGETLYSVYCDNVITGNEDSGTFSNNVAEIQNLYGFYDCSVYKYDSRLNPPEVWLGGTKNVLIDENKSITYDTIRQTNINFVDDNGNIIDDLEEEFYVGLDFEDKYVQGYAISGQGGIKILDGTYKVKLYDSASWKCNSTITVDSTHTNFNIIVTENQNNGNNPYPDVQVEG